MSDINIKKVLELHVGCKIGQLRAVPVSMDKRGTNTILATYCADFDVDPYMEMFYFPTDTLKMILFTLEGDILWKKDLGPGVVPGVWFCPVFPFDLDGDGVDEIWYVNNVNTKHPLGVSGYRLERLDAHTGRATGQWVWPNKGGIHQSLSHTFRNLIIGGYANNKPILITAQGTYANMYLQGFNSDMTLRWETAILKEEPGARGSHVCPVVDINNDGIDELMWGERCIEINGGKELFCADRDVYKGHSDMVQPILDQSSGNWYIYTAREGDPTASPRVALFDDKGKRVWGAVESGHMDMSWVARLGENGRHVAMSIQIDHKTCGPEGRFHQGCKEYTYDALTGEALPLPFATYGTIPVDVNGDGIHELVGNGKIIDRNGNILSSIGGKTAICSKFMNRPGEQVLCYYPDGEIKVWADENACDSQPALERYLHEFYKRNMKFTSTGSNKMILGGI